ncbi:protein-disulfide reductase DsbD [Erwinia sp. OLTSP20]|uniref:protein-disulfide reductase DsbD n=1 Tax=unclassified Erwinia TaxID=2622719 RepID=UPI000C1A68FB|nr:MULTISPECIES: protein-disulfide reductase DsbD [unclassified Erwinia]PIJ52096.1 protein-disulfide reductase DsbD [Erwinia sp. OAMSP11]PIJ75258.1 protein-disulfide reductase DsbD [Erwinia sp. OLSSP12]PIJ84465.1 protein-disulfide reductase DsbD [Erwinia sp. OLCASP19]PIJ87079.1 protein-disulfide reductase DsbD [Erwinia sp. OLMTSP26]PIJ88643.1 protein-disulfide reductase DsbD [Erwinia sp. OLMDSP33]
MAYRILTLILALLAGITASHASLFDNTPRSQFVTVNQAFAFDFRQQQHQLTVSWQVKPGYYLYRQQIHITPHNARLADWSLPKGQPHEDEFYGKTEIFPQDLTLPLTVQQAQQGATLEITYQGCAAAGFCYPPETRSIPLEAIRSAGATSIASQPMPEASAPATKNAPADALPFSALWALLIGIGVAFTPCVLPMYPLISGIILGANRQYTLSRLFALAFAYVQGMAITYTLFGLVVAAAGLRFQAALQQPWLLISLSVIFMLLALSMFGLFTLQLPASIQTRLALWSNRQRGGSLPGVFIMGALAGLICSPCTTAPLSAILLYIAQSGNLLAGAGTLYLYALGMGLPLIVVTLSGNRLLPKSGPWMQTVKEGFGFVILALPVFLLERVIGESWGLRLWSALAITVCIWAFSLALKSTRGWARVMQVLLLAVALVAARPLQDWAFSAPAVSEHNSAVPFTPISDTTALTTALTNSSGKITMLDLYADWCVACKEFARYTFSDPEVAKQLNQLQLLQADVTRNTPQDTQLLKQLQVLGLPTVLFFDKAGHEIPDSRITGYLDAAAFNAHLQKLTR